MIDEASSAANCSGVSPEAPRYTNNTAMCVSGTACVKNDHAIERIAYDVPDGDEIARTRKPVLSVAAACASDGACVEFAPKPVFQSPTVSP